VFKGAVSHISLLTPHTDFLNFYSVLYQSMRENYFHTTGQSD